MNLKVFSRILKLGLYLYETFYHYFNSKVRSARYPFPDNQVPLVRKIQIR